MDQPQLYRREKEIFPGLKKTFAGKEHRLDKSLSSLDFMATYMNYYKTEITSAKTKAIIR
jgi:hypothetical protein